MKILRKHILALAVFAGVAGGLHVAPHMAMAQTGFSFDSLVGESSKAIEVDADALEVVQSESLARFTGNVVARQGTLNLTAQAITLHYRTGDTPGAPVSLIEAQNGVTMSSLSESVTCNWLRYDIDTGMIVLGGNVVLKRDGNSLRGDRLVIDVNTGLSRLEASPENGGRVRGVFVPGKGFEQ